MGIKQLIAKVVPYSILEKRSENKGKKRVKKVVQSIVFPKKPGNYPEGINVVGPVKAEMGLGQSCRLLVKAIKDAGIDCSVRDFEVNGVFRSEDDSFKDIISDETPYGINIVHVEPPEIMVKSVCFPTEFWSEKYNIAFWLWELESFPKNWIPATELFDEIWTPSEFASESIRKITDKPVITIPYSVTAETDSKYDRKYFGLPEDKFLFLIMFDANSTMTRKNPFGAIEAYKKAFSPDDDTVGLVIKTNNAQEKKLDPVKKLLDGYKNVYFITDILEKKAVNSLIKDVDVFVSLHRAEGFGLVMAEAMLNNTVCIATNWSSNTEFMNSDVACMVNFSFVTLDKDIPPYKKGAKWADANIDEAASFMKRLRDDKEYYNNLSVKAKEYIENKLSADRVSGLIKKRISEIRETINI